MPSLSLVLSPPALQRLHDALACLAKFSEYVTFEASRNKLSLTALNSSKSAHGAINLLGGRFFDTYHFMATQGRGLASPESESKFQCRLHTKALLSVFRERYIDAKDKDTAIETCEVTLGDKPIRGECRLHVRFFCKHGVVKTYKLTYEDVEVMNAVFDKNAAHNRWRINSKLLKEYMEHFGPKAEQLDISGVDGRATFTSFTEKLMDGAEILKQPLHTAVTMDTLEFEEFTVEEELHITISLKDFKAAINHADSLNAIVCAYYSNPGRPLQLQYTGDGMDCEFTLMTVGARSSQPLARIVSRPRPPQASRESNVNQSARSTTRNESQDSNRQGLDIQQQSVQQEMEIEPQTGNENESNTTAQSDLPLFLSGADEDDQSEENNDYDNDDDVLGWDIDMDHSARTGRTVTQNQLKPVPKEHESEYDDNDEDFEEPEEPQVVGPTQVTPARGLFD